MKYVVVTVAIIFSTSSAYADESVGLNVSSLTGFWRDCNLICESSLACVEKGEVDFYDNSGTNLYFTSETPNPNEPEFHGVSDVSAYGSK